MNMDLSAAGLSPTLAKAYSELVTHRSVAPAPFSVAIGETRTNTYKLLDELVALGLAEKYEAKKKLRYRAQNPQRLMQLAQERREALHHQEKVMQQHVMDLTREFNQVSEQPGVRFYQGKSSMRRVYTEMLETGADLYLIRSPHDVNFFDKDMFQDLLKARTTQGINTYALTPDVDSANHNPALDRANNMFRTWLPEHDYTAPVEWNIAGNKVAIVSYGKEAFATILESQQIADSLRQLFNLIRDKQSHTNTTTAV